MTQMEPGSNHTDLATTCVRLFCEDETLEASAEAIPPCRFQLVEAANGARVVLDVGHNPAALERVAGMFRSRFDVSQSALVVGLAKDKDAKGCLAALASAGAWGRVEFTRASPFVGRAFADPSALAQAWPLSAAATVPTASPPHEHVASAVRRAVEYVRGNRNGAVLVCGSHNLMADSLMSLGQPGVERDPFDTNEGAPVPLLPSS